MTNLGFSCGSGFAGYEQETFGSGVVFERIQFSNPCRQVTQIDFRFTQDKPALELSLHKRILWCSLESFLHHSCALCCPTGRSQYFSIHKHA